jgi:hypothetical protein
VWGGGCRRVLTRFRVDSSSVRVVGNECDKYNGDRSSRRLIPAMRASIACLVISDVDLCHTFVGEGSNTVRRVDCSDMLKCSYQFLQTLYGSKS